MKKILASLAIAFMVLSLLSVVAPKARGLVSANSASSKPSSGGPLSTPIVRHDANGNLAMVTASLSDSHWWVIDLWADHSGGHLPSKMNGTFIAAPNYISGLASGDAVLYLPLNVAYGTSSTNCVWFQFDVELDAGGVTNWYIWDVLGPGTSNSDYHYTAIGIPYKVGDGYSFSLTTSGTNTVTFSIKDTTTGANWSNSNWEWTVPSLTLRYDTSMFSPASAVEGYTTNNQLGNVPYFLTTTGFGITTFSNESTSVNGPIPSGVGVFVYAGPTNYFYWAMDTENYVSTFNSYGTTGGGSVTNPNDLAGIQSDGQYTQLYGGNYGDSGWEVGNLNAPTSGHVYVYGYSYTGYYSHFIVAVSSDGSTWTTLFSQTLNPANGPYYIDCGSTTSSFKYIKLTGTDDTGLSARVLVDAVHILS